MTDRTEAERLDGLFARMDAAQKVRGRLDPFLCHEDLMLLRQEYEICNIEAVRLQQERDAGEPESAVIVERSHSARAEAEQLAEIRSAWDTSDEVGARSIRFLIEQLDQRDTDIARLQQERDAATREAEALRIKAGLPPIKTPWEQAMRETIDGQGLSMREMGNELREKDAIIKALREEVGTLREAAQMLVDAHDYMRTDTAEQLSHLRSVLKETAKPSADGVERSQDHQEDQTSQLTWNLGGFMPQQPEEK